MVENHSSIKSNDYVTDYVTDYFADYVTDYVTMSPPKMTPTRTHISIKIK